uniref:DNA mismatch repair proteins mutS family domain-containing protein n=1 Tax=Plectus sambesii TaxID=2011161 RepID=A0A914ULJ6_9BILA
MALKHMTWLSDCRLKEIVERLHETIDENVSHQKGALNMRSQRCFAIKSGINSSLDFVRRTYTELIEDVSEAAAEETATCPYPMRTVYSVGRGFHLTTTVRDGAGGVVLPDCFINVVRQRNTITCTTRTLIRLNDRLNQAVASVMQLSNEVVTALLADLRQYIACLYNLTEVLANVDMLTSIAHFCSLAQSVRPEFSSSLAIRAGRHPLLERTALCEMTPNDTYASAESCFVIITGPNMAGKSTYLKQVALLQIMAQAGCMVPADYACFRVCDHIFSRIDYNDDLENNSSAFMVEMKDMSYILQHLTDKSLVVIDELGRSTSTEEGIGLSFAICEELILSSALVFFATHFLDLAILDANYSCVENYHFGPQVVRTHEEDGDVVEKLEPNHKLAKGPYRGPLYGFELAEVSTLPRSVLNCAKELALKLREQSAILRSNDEEQRRQRAEFRLGQRLLRAAKFAKNADEEKMRLYLKNLKLQYHADIAAVNIC